MLTAVCAIHQHNGTLCIPLWHGVPASIIFKNWYIWKSIEVELAQQVDMQAYMDTDHGCMMVLPAAQYSGTIGCTELWQTGVCVVL